MIRKKIVCILLCLGLMASLLSAVKWQKSVIGYLGDFKGYDNMRIYLKTNFKDIPRQEQGAAALLLAYAHFICSKERNKKNAGQSLQDVSYWFERFLIEFQEKDDNLGFLKKDCHEDRTEILAFKDKWKKGLPVLYNVSIINDPREPVSLKDAFEMDYFSPGPNLYLKVESSAPCHYEVYDDGEEPLKVDRSQEKVFILPLPIGEQFVKAGTVGFKSFALVLAGKYRNRKRLEFSMTYKWPKEEFDFNPVTGHIKIKKDEKHILEVDKNGYATTHVFEKYKKRIFSLRAKAFRNQVLPLLVTGSLSFAAKKLVLDNVDMGGDTSAAWKGHTDTSGKVFGTMSIGLSVNALYRMFSKKAFPFKYVKRKRRVMTKEEYNAKIDQRKDLYKSKVKVSVKVRILDAYNNIGSEK